MCNQCQLKLTAQWDSDFRQTETSSRLLFAHYVYSYSGVVCIDVNQEEIKCINWHLKGSLKNSLNLIC